MAAATATGNDIVMRVSRERSMPRSIRLLCGSATLPMRAPVMGIVALSSIAGLCSFAFFGAFTMRRLLTLIGLTLAGCTAASSPQGPAPPALGKLDHIVVVYLENRSFDNLFGEFPGADGLRNAGGKATQVSLDGKPYRTLPPVMDTAKTPPVPDPRFPQDLPNKPFLIDQYIGLEDKDPNLTHLWYQQQAQIDGGRMDKFAA